VSTPLKILVVDDTPTNLVLIAKFVAQLGHSALLARSGQEALERFQAESPDMVLMDVMMPGMDGLETTTRLRKLSDGRWVPVIFLSAKAQEQDQVAGLEAGGDDYLTKPVSLTLLAAKIRAMQRIADMQRQITENLGQLAQYREDNEREQALARHLLERIVRTDRIDHRLVRRWILPAADFSGDIIAAATTPDNVLHAILADGTGHGLSAALSAMPVVEVFYGMTEKGFSISTIASELNRKIRDLLPTERFVAAALASIDPVQRTVAVWNGGIPPVLLLDAQGRPLREWASSHPPLGILDDEAFDGHPESFRWQEPAQLFICSDGLVEAESLQNGRFGHERLLDALSDVPRAERFDRLVAAVECFLGGAPGADDISLLAVECPMDDGEHPAGEDLADHGRQPQHSLAQWRVALKLEAGELRAFDIRPLLMSWLSHLQLEPKVCREVFLIVSELFNNALDHGILGLDSDWKSAEQGFDHYLRQRAERLSALQDGSIEMELARVRREGVDYLELRLRDSGGGFDYRDTLGQPQPVPGGGAGTPAGRGIMLVRSLCTEVEYSTAGNEVKVRYRLG
jgi:DNA-binding response OmpR family regulator/anti-sigma regulatory factor (Ser/Thr protein kinase)